MAAFGFFVVLFGSYTHKFQSTMTETEREQFL